MPGRYVPNGPEIRREIIKIMMDGRHRTAEDVLHALPDGVKEGMGTGSVGAHLRTLRNMGLVQVSGSSRTEKGGGVVNTWQVCPL